MMGRPENKTFTSFFPRILRLVFIHSLRHTLTSLYTHNKFLSLSLSSFEAALTHTPSETPCMSAVLPESEFGVIVIDECSPSPEESCELVFLLP